MCLPRENCSCAESEAGTASNYRRASEFVAAMIDARLRPGLDSGFTDFSTISATSCSNLAHLAPKSTLREMNGKSRSLPTGRGADASHS
jgi:hypothetical protein